MDGKKDIPPFITLARKLFHDPMWTQERFSYAQAWVDLLYWAYHSTVILNGKVSAII